MAKRSNISYFYFTFTMVEVHLVMRMLVTAVFTRLIFGLLADLCVPRFYSVLDIDAMAGSPLALCAPLLIRIFVWHVWRILSGSTEDVGIEPTWPFQTVPSLASSVHTVVLPSKVSTPGLEPGRPCGH